MALCVWWLSKAFESILRDPAEVQFCSGVWHYFSQGRTIDSLLRKVCLDFFFCLLLCFVVRSALAEDQDIFLPMWGMYIHTYRIVAIASLLFSNVISISSSYWGVILLIGLLILFLFWNRNLLVLDRVYFFEIWVEWDLVQLIWYPKMWAFFTYSGNSDLHAFFQSAYILGCH